MNNKPEWNGSELHLWNQLFSPSLKWTKFNHNNLSTKKGGRGWGLTKKLTLVFSSFSLSVVFMMASFLQCHHSCRWIMIKGWLVAIFTISYTHYQYGSELTFFLCVCGGCPNTHHKIYCLFNAPLEIILSMVYHQTINFLQLFQKLRSCS